MDRSTKTKGSRLGEQITKRLGQLGMSRRELSRRVNISRQTLHFLEHEPERNFAPSTFEELDRGLKWSPGTARAFHDGILLGGNDMNVKVVKYIKSILAHLESMDIEQLEREVLMLEEESYGRESAANPSSTEISRIISKLMTALADESEFGEKNAK